MNIITKKSINDIGYNFIPAEFIPKGKDEYYLRNKQHRTKTKYRQLTKAEIKLLTANGSSSDDWAKILVADTFNPTLIKNCSFYGLIRIGKQESLCLEFHNLRLPVGLYNSTIISSDIGDNVVINNVNFLSHYIIGNDVMLANVNELATTNHAKFGNGVLKQGENESIRTWMEICNENAGRSVLPFNGMQAGDAWLWSKYREDEKLLQKFKEFTDKQFDTKRGYYGKIGDRTVIKNCKIVKDVWIGTDAYLKGANKIKNITINSSAAAKSQIGEGCELVNGIIGFGCRIFYGVKAVRFVMGSNSQLKYGARLINSYLGDNSTISCCEVLNSLIFPGHEQHHNNSFLCASTVMGQSNMAAGATIGSNHNSRGADGEIIAGRGFWPGLCVSLKHNSKFASFTIIAKGDFPAELNIPIPFSLVSNDVANDKILVMPGYWFLYNLYALCRNEVKYSSRDKRIDKSQVLEYDVFAPDSINEMVEALGIMKVAVAKAWAEKNKKIIIDNGLEEQGEILLETRADEISKLEVLAEGFENSKRKVQLVKVVESYKIFKELVIYYGTRQLMNLVEKKKITSWQKLVQTLPASPQKEEWKNIGGQLMTASSVAQLIKKINSGKISGWEEVHQFYNRKSSVYYNDKVNHAWAVLLDTLKISPKKFTKKLFYQLLKQSVTTREWLSAGIYSSRARDYQNPFRKMVYDTEKEMEKVIGSLKDNSFINQQNDEVLVLKGQVEKIISAFS